MLSFISSSEVGGRSGSPYLHLGLFGCTFIVLAGLSSSAWNVLPLGKLVLTPPPLLREHYLVGRGYGGGALDHHILFHGRQHTTKHLKSAEVLLLGNSRLMVGLPEDLTKRMFAHIGRSFYVLGFGHGERDLFPMSIIKKYDLHPKYVIIHAEYSFFTNEYSGHGKKVVNESWFQASREIFEETASYRFQNCLHTVLPHWLKVATKRLPGPVYYRSRRNGLWRFPSGYPMAYPVPDAPGPDNLTDLQKQSASRFKAEMDRRGTKMILTWVPSSDGSRKFAELFAAHLQVPLVAPIVPNLETFDHSHLTPESAERFTTEFFVELARNLRAQEPAP